MFLGTSNAHAYFLNTFIKLEQEVTLMLCWNQQSQFYNITKRGLRAGSVVMVEEQAAGRGRSRCACSRGGWRPPIALTAGKGPSGHPQAQMFRGPLLPPCPWLPPTRPDERWRPLLHIFHSSPVRQSPIR